MVRTITLKKQLRGCHYVTEEIKKALPEISQLKMGILHLFKLGSICYSLSYKHTCEGADDMPAHAKQALLGGPSITVPITKWSLHIIENDVPTIILM
ncbi:UPF0047 protein YjbQ [Schistosoma japonicum]|nr:UPF0047 protein YjbQ [Schistosoma japonicum]